MIRYTEETVGRPYSLQKSATVNHVQDRNPLSPTMVPFENGRVMMKCDGESPTIEEKKTTLSCMYMRTVTACLTIAGHQFSYAGSIVRGCCRKINLETNLKPPPFVFAFPSGKPLSCLRIPRQNAPLMENREHTLHGPLRRLTACGVNTRGCF